MHAANTVLGLQGIEDSSTWFILYTGTLLSSETNGESVMKILLSKRSMVIIALLMLLSFNAIAGMIALAGAASVQDPTVHVNGSGSIEVTWKSGKSQSYSSDSYVKLGGLDFITFTPRHGWHIDAVLIDGNMQEIFDEDGFTLFDVQAKSIVSVTFLENGGVDDVEAGSGVEAYPDPEVGLVFDDVLTDGLVYAYIIGLRHPDQIGESWDIQTNATFDPDVTVYLMLNLTDLPDGVDPYNLTLWRTEVVLGDVNLDGKVDGTDVSIIANANPDDTADPRLDLNNDGVVDDEDVTIATHNVGEESVWEPLESWVFVENDLVYVYGVADHLSIFGVTRTW